MFHSIIKRSAWRFSACERSVSVPVLEPWGWKTARWCALLLSFILVQNSASPQEPPGNVAPLQSTPPITVPVEAPVATTLPKVEEVQARLKAVAEDAALSVDIKTPLSDVLTKLNEQLTTIGQQQKRTESLAAAAAAAPVELAKSQQLKDANQSEERWMPTRLYGAEEIRAKKDEIDSILEAKLKQHSELDAEIRKRDERRKMLPQLVIDARTELQKLESEPPILQDNNVDDRLKVAREQLAMARLVAATGKLTLLQQELKTYAAQESLLPLQRELLNRDIQQLKAINQRLSARLADQRSLDIESLRSNLHSRIELLPPGQKSLVQTSLPLVDKWESVVKRSVQIEEKLAKAKAQSAAVAKDLEEARGRINQDLENNAGLSNWMGMLLQRKREQLPNLTELHGELLEKQSEIDEIKALQSEVEAHLDDLREIDLTNPTVLDTVRVVEREALQEMHADLSKYDMKLLEFSAEREKLIHDVQAFQALVEEHVLWMRSTEPLRWSDIPGTWRAFQVMVHVDNLRELKAVAIAQVGKRPDIFILWIGGTAALLYLANRLRRRMTDLSEQALKKNATRMGPTWMALMITFVLSLPVVYLLAMLGWRLAGATNTSNYVHAVGHGILTGAIFLMPLEFLRQITRPHGLALSHFQWPKDAAHTLRVNLRWMIDLGLPLVIAWAATGQLLDSRIIVPLNRTLFTVLVLVAAGLLWRVLHPRKGLFQIYLTQNQGGWLDRLRYVWHSAATSIPLLIAGLSCAGYGYLAGRLAIHLFNSLWIVIGLLLLGGLATRWVLLSRRRMLLAQMQQRAEQMRRDADRDLNAGPVDIPETAPIDISQVSQQTLRLIRAVLAVGALVGLTWVWSSVLPALNIFDKVELWSTTGRDGEQEWITLSNILFAVPVMVLTVVAVRNLPGLLETLVLQHLPLQTAARYAITMMSTYALGAVGIIFFANVIGVNWASIQWLVAALGVGLGFGLQEIFANFISGIILLFEQPIRVGDVITLDGTTGVVSRIRIRATTVTNWDRQELIIPNKDLITGRLLNWTLSDSINRVIFKVGVAYGTDTRKACAILKRICEEHPNVTKDPPPVISFDEFANSQLNITVRAFLSSLEVRLQTIHELHTQVHEAFKEEKIEIAFPQQDIHLRTVPPGWLPTTPAASG